MASSFRRRRHCEDITLLKNGENFLRTLITSCDGKYNPITSFSARELKTATNNYDVQNVITYARYHKLFRTTIICSEQKRPIFVMKFEGSRGYEYCFNNIVFVSQIRHKNVLKLIGCCLETEIPILVFEPVANGTLADRIHDCDQPHLEPFLLKHRLKIAMQIANALTYLHVGFPRPIVFRDINPSHILLDEQYLVKLFDFSVSKSIPEGETHIKDDLVTGTMGFVAPEHCATFDYNEKCDVYSFGVLLLELLTGHKIIDLGRLAKKDDGSISAYVQKHIDEMVNPVIGGDGSYPEQEQQLRDFIELISKCINRSAEDRPTMMDVAKQLRQMYLASCYLVNIYSRLSVS